MTKGHSQLKQVLDYLQEHGSITSWDAITKFRITRLSSIIYTLRHSGYDIKSTMVDFTTDDGRVSHYAKYTLVTEGDF